MRVKKILYLSRGGSINGCQRQLLYVIKGLNRKAYEPLVVCHKQGRFTDMLRKLRVKTLVCPLHPWRKYPSALLRYFDAERIVKYSGENHISLVHCSDLWLNGYMRWLKKRLKIPSILHVRTPVSVRDVRKHCCNQADVIIAISIRVMRNLIAAGVRSDRIAQIDDGVDIELFRPYNGDNVLRRDFSVNEGPLVGIVGRISESKCQLDFLKAAELVKKSNHKKAIFFLIGRRDSDTYTKKIEKFIKSRGLKDSVFFTDERDDMQEVIPSLDVLVSLSGGSVMFEAMSCGTPVISAGFTSRNDAVHLQDGKTGLLVSSRSVSDLVKAINRLLENQVLRTTIGKQARRWAVYNLNHQKMVLKTQRIYELLV